MSWWSRLSNVFHTSRLERELDEELQFHLDARARELTDTGLAPEAARAEARRRFGNTLRLREQSRDAKLLPWLDSIVRDVAIGARMLHRNAMVSGAAIVSLALALGACFASFALVDALILRPLPVREPERLIYLGFPTYEPARPESETFNDPAFRQLRDAGRGRVNLFAMSTQVMRRVTFDDANGEKETVRTQFASGDAFERLGVLPHAGRMLAPHDDLRPGAHPVAVISHAFWMRRFGGDGGIIGRGLTLDGQAVQIVGVAASRFSGVEPGRPTDLWLPYAMYNPRAFGNSSFNWFRIFGRIEDGVEAAEIQPVLQAAFTNFRRVYAQQTGRGRSPESLARLVNAPLFIRSAALGPSPVRRQYQRPLWILAAITALVLLIAGSHVANLFLARAEARSHEMALRMAIGAGRARLVQQLLIESAMVAMAAGVAGLLFAVLVTPSIVGMLAPGDDPVQLDLAIDWRLGAFAVGLTAVTTCIFGLVPALRASATGPVTALKQDGPRSVARSTALRPFMAVQVALVVIVLFVGSLLVRSFARLTGVDPGFATSGVLLLSLETVERDDPAQRRAALLQLLDRLRAVPGVHSVAAAEFNALGRAWTHNIHLPGTAHDSVEVTMQPVSPGYFETMGVPVRAGRTFARRELETDDPGVVVVNEAFARRYFGDAGAVGRTVNARFAEATSHMVHEVIGVVADTRYDLREPVGPTVYIPLPFRAIGTIHVRTIGDPAMLSARLRNDVHAATAWFRVTSITSQSTVMGNTLLRERLLALLAGFFAIVGLVLAAVGLHGVLSYAVVRRSREIGLRMALGAPRVGVIATVVRDAATATLAGAVCGLAGAMYVSRYVETLLFEVTPLDASSVIVPVALLLTVVLLAAALPALRITRVDPVIALRCE